MRTMMLMMAAATLAAAGMTMTRAQAATDGAVPTVFPDGSTTPDAEALKQRIAGHVYELRAGSGSGSTMRLDYRQGGTAFFNEYPSGWSGSGQWWTEEGKVCSKGPGFENCVDVRLLGDALYMKRRNGNVVPMLAQ